MDGHEQRTARDGHAYTWEDFVTYYGSERALQEWEEANVGASQPNEMGDTGEPPTVGASQPNDFADTEEDSVSTMPVSNAGAAQSGGGRAPVPAPPPPAPEDRLRYLLQPTARPSDAPSFQSLLPTLSPPRLPGSNPPRSSDAGATQPGGVWHATPFFTTTLPQNAALIVDPSPKARNPRQTINLAYDLYEHLPLHARVLTVASFNLASALGEPSCVEIVAERVRRIPDPNRALQRVDLFAYHPDGTVVRHHPGKSPSQSAKPQSMQTDSVLFRRATACEIGVGAALHLEPPAYVENVGGTHPGAIVFTRAHMDAISPFDSKSLSSRFVWAKLQSMPETESKDWTSGHDCAWWVWLANMGKLRQVVANGVISVTALPAQNAVIVLSTAGRFRISSNSGKLQIKQMQP